ncbi:hypothetical protein B296_00015665 [Ensete ventricosum]|uniref:Uncharacterized protein n=1 Tax=Ensete ventricosum TaxID=4639 RepID=A0A426XD26_ENSVE|nr:hypothetical protein B296_00015665 [Ensete ventricosum]
MNAGHDLNTAVIEGSLAAIRERYNISTEYGLHVLQPERTCLGLGLSQPLEMIELWLVEVGLSPASRGADWMDLDDLRGMPRASGGKTPTAHSAASTQEAGEGPPIEAPRPSSKRSSDASVQPDDLAQRHKEVRKDDVGYYALYMSDLAQQDSDKEMRVRWENLKDSSKVWSDHAAAEEFERGLLHSQLERALYTLQSEVLLARAAKEMVLVIPRL